MRERSVNLLGLYFTGAEQLPYVNSIPPTTKGTGVFPFLWDSLAAAGGTVTRRANGLAGRGVHLQTDGADAKFLLTGDDAAFHC
jgi:hypothetical protein